MTKFVAILEYDGTCYHGWQLQKALPTVQGEMEIALERILGKPTRVYGAGRTDAGVHAKGQVAHFVADWSHQPADLRKACNALLPPDIMVRRLDCAPDDFHARHSARLKTYVYQILNRSIRSPLDRLYSWHFPHALDIALMNRAARSLKGAHDFSAFGRPTDGTPSTVREIVHANWDLGQSDGMLYFTITGTGFLRYMVRSIVGTVVFVGSGKISPDLFAKILELCDRSQAGPTAPPHGLYLLNVHYGSNARTAPVDPSIIQGSSSNEEP